MLNIKSPRDAALELQRNPILWPGTDERFTGYGVIALPFASGHYLALRNMAATSIGPGYRNVWHRAPDGQWTFIADAAPEQSSASATSGFPNAGCSSSRTQPSRTSIRPDTMRCSPGRR